MGLERTCRWTRTQPSKTRQVVELLGKIGIYGRKVLILTDGQKEAVFKSARNLPAVHVMPYTDASTYHILWSDVVLVEQGALDAPAGASEGEA